MESRLSSDRLGPVETLRIDYRHRRTFTVETTGGNGFSYTWIYAEALEIDRDAQTITLHRQWNENVDVTTRYRIAGGVSPLLDECAWYFVGWAGISCNSTPLTATRSSMRRSTRRSTANSSCAYGAGAATSCSWTGCIRIRSSPARRTAFRIFGARPFRATSLL